MQNLITLILFLPWTAFAAIAQCPGSPLTLSTQAQVNSFPTNYPGCSEMNVSLTIQGNNIANLDGLSGLTSITKSLFIKNNPALTSLTGLSNLSNIGVELTFDNNDALTDLSGLESLPFIGGTLTLTGNALLNSLEGLSGIAYVNGSLFVSFNPALGDLNGLDNVAFTGRFLQISNNNGLTSLNSLNSLTEVGNNVATMGRYLSISSNPNLTTLNGLSNLVSVGTDFEIANNGNLVSLNAFANLATIGGEFSITGNTDLTSVTDFASLSSVGGDLVISNNNVLSDCAAQGICDYLEGPGNAIISNNDPGCNSVAQVEAECLLLPVQLTFFNGKLENERVLLTWETASEKNNDYFLVEHSTKGSPFKTLDRVAGNSASSTLNKYSFQHQQPSKGANYYRLKQVDFDGKFEHSNIVGVFVEDENAVDIFPNPTTGPVFVKGNAPERFGRVADLAGRMILEKNLSESSLIDLSDQPQGVYFIEIRAGSVKTVKRVVKQ